MSTAPPPMKATQEEMMNAKIDLQYRDFCAHLLIPLNACREKNYWMPWTCGHEKHVFEKCQYQEYMRRVRKANEMAAGAYMAP